MILQVLNSADPHAHLVTYSSLLGYLGSILGVVLTQFVIVLIFIGNKISDVRKDAVAEGVLMMEKINGNEIKCQQSLDIATETQAMTLRFKQDYQKMIDNFADKNTAEHKEIVNSLQRTSDNLTALAELTRNVSIELGKHFGYHEGLVEGEKIEKKKK
jgi:hypothetical protein